ncbi:hypothetical protein [Legionella jamestowniensis]|uniref:Swiss Army Knife 2H phosphoesterase domain-containing protein n=1 Tax=Legionella jamestowniensis TaxID=455 RepID=A0A0W0UTY7_9GAMM|nr:hypothetical protein [Legionella jamestowniensis]KTD11339.1 hypothetical protein Ljam_0533 [Legionella jamestowniensis]SFL68840.1 hypothetical protein SAMN02746073_1380 [Legionella jamestowniensis DSM 19215]
MTTNYLKLKRLDIPDLLDAALNLPTSGDIKQSKDGLLYLDIADSYIHDLYPFLKNYSSVIIKPDYFGQKSAGAHISIIYPEENSANMQEELGKTHHFKVLQVVSGDLGHKRYYVLTVSAPTLIEVRKKYQLGPQLKFKDHWIDLHITLGVSML